MYESKQFYTTAKYDGIVRNVTFALWILLIVESGFFVYLFYVVIPVSFLSMVIAVLIPTFSLIVLLVPYLFKPNGFVLNSQELKIKRIMNDISVPYKLISKIERGKWTWKVVRLGGSGGLYGYLGLFHFFDIGNVWMYVTNRNKLVLIELISGKKYAISPENIEDFVFQIKKLI